MRIQPKKLNLKIMVAVVCGGAALGWAAYSYAGQSAKKVTDAPAAVLINPAPSVTIAQSTSETTVTVPASDDDVERLKTRNRRLEAMVAALRARVEKQDETAEKQTDPDRTVVVVK